MPMKTFGDSMLTICPNCRNPISSDETEDVCPVCFFVELGLIPQGEETSFLLPGITMQGEIARGGVGIVYLGQQATPQRQLAVKVLQPQWARDATICSRFRREAQTMGALAHPV